MVRRAGRQRNPEVTSFGGGRVEADALRSRRVRFSSLEWRMTHLFRPPFHRHPGAMSVGCAGAPLVVCPALILGLSWMFHTPSSCLRCHSLHFRGAYLPVSRAVFHPDARYVQFFKESPRGAPPALKCFVFTGRSRI